MAGRNKNSIEVGEKSVVVMGNESKIKGKKGTLIVFYEKDKNENIISYQAVIIDGRKVKEDTWYKLENKKLMEVKN